MVTFEAFTNSEPLLGKERLSRRSLCPAIVLVADFGDDSAKAECQLSLSSVFHRNKVEPPDLITVNDIVQYSRVHAAFIFSRLACLAPPNTIFIGVVDPGVGTDRKGIIVATAKEHYFIGPDNGIFYPAADSEGITGIWHIDNRRFPNSSATFHGRDIFSKVAAEIASGTDPDSLGVQAEDLIRLEFQAGQIVHVDRYGNLKINAAPPNGETHITLPNGRAIPLVHTFEDVDIGQPLAYLGSSGLLEIAIRQGNAANTFGFNIGECLSI